MYLFLSQFVASLYSSLSIPSSGLFELLSRFAFLWVIWWWLKEDGKQFGSKWVLDLGMFLFIAWIFILPYHLFKTRGVKALIPILAFVLVILSATAAAVMVGMFLRPG